jgi:hypothetical protein
MNKSTIIATCLVNSSMVRTLEDGESSIRRIFQDEFPSRDFAEWDANVDDTFAQNTIKTVGRASRINVRSFIEDLSQ